MALLERLDWGAIFVAWDVQIGLFKWTSFFIMPKEKEIGNDPSRLLLDGEFKKYMCVDIEILS